MLRHGNSRVRMGLWLLFFRRWVLNLKGDETAIFKLYVPIEVPKEYLRRKNLDDNTRNIALQGKKPAIVCLIKQLNSFFVICSFVQEDDSSNNT